MQFTPLLIGQTETYFLFRGYSIANQRLWYTTTCILLANNDFNYETVHCHLFSRWLGLGAIHGNVFPSGRNESVSARVPHVQGKIFSAAPRPFPSWHYDDMEAPLSAQWWPLGQQAANVGQYGKSRKIDGLQRPNPLLHRQRRLYRSILGIEWIYAWSACNLWLTRALTSESAAATPTSSSPRLTTKQHLTIPTATAV